MAEFRIIVAEDDDDDYFILKEAFDQFAACDLRRAKDGKLLIDYLNKRSHAALKLPDLLILDINMPKIGGVEALKFVKASPVFSPVPVIMHSTCFDDDVKRQCFKLGAIGFTSKGNSQKDFLSFARSVLFFLNERKPLSRFVHNSKRADSQN